MNSLSERDKRVIWHPFTPQDEQREVIPIIKGEGSYLIDESGARYIDAISSWWVNLHGHGNPFIAEKLYQQAKQLEHVIFAGFTHEPAIVLAEKLLALLPGNFSKVFYSDNGSTSTEVAIKLALQFWWNSAHPKANKRNKIIALSNSYHGDTFGAMSVSERGIFTLPFHEKLFEVHFISVSDEDMRTLDERFDLSDVACFIYEPLVQGAGGMIMYDARVLDGVLSSFKKHEVICIADEVMTGFHRTGPMFASALCNEKPDLMCLSKGLTGTLPLGVTACTDKIYKAFEGDEKKKTFFHGHSFTANPIACAAAIASLELLGHRSCQQAIRCICDQQTSFASRLSTLSFQNIKNIRSLGTIVAFEVNMGEDGYLNDISSRITKLALSQGVYLRPLGNTLYIMPPYCITQQELSTVHETVISILHTL